MNKLTQLELSESGIIVFGGRPGMGLTRITLKIANQLAKKSNTVFISYQDYKEKLMKIIEQQGESPNPLLSINPDLNFYEYGFAQDIEKLIKSTSAQTIIIDDLDGMLGENFKLDNKYRNKFLSELQSIAEDSTTRIILNVTVSRKVEYRGGDKKPMLRDFTWTRNLTDIAKQVYTVYRPEYYGLIEDENGHSTSGRIEIDRIKDSNCKETNYRLVDKEEGILL